MTAEAKGKPTPAPRNGGVRTFGRKRSTPPILHPSRPGALRCEASTSYTFFPHRRLRIWDDLKEYNPDLRIIYVVRKPTDRILSHYRYSVRRGYTGDDIRDFVLRYPLPLAISRYHTQISPFIEAFGRDRVLLLDFEDVVLAQDRTLAQVAAFLGLEAGTFAGTGSIHSNRSGLPADLAQTIIRELEAEKSALERLTDRDLSTWRTP